MSGLRMTVTWEFSDGPAEKALALAERWLAEQLGEGTPPPRPVRVECQSITTTRPSVLTARRQALGLTVRQLAARARIDPQVIAAAENGALAPGTAGYSRVSAVLTDLEAR
ncbi:helix-turn-helix domain-containing protein [Spongiactinospora rosea]|nr:helix-turn-helix transcriptional regulator [Spongiactinospora rosea]